MSKIWYITGTSRGFGKTWATAALERGDKVAATARITESLQDLVDRFGDAVLPIPLDVTDREASFSQLNAAYEHFGRLDVVVNNAGYGHFGFIEELTESEIRAQLETNVFGALWTTQAAIPLLRAQGGGHIVQVSSIGGATALPGLGAYHASKWALEGFTEALGQEVAGFGIKTTIIQPGPFATDWRGSSAIHSDESEEYASFRGASNTDESSPASPQAIDTVEAVMTAIDADNPPVRLLLGSLAFDWVVGVTEQRVQTWRNWEEVTRSADAT